MMFVCSVNEVHDELLSSSLLNWAHELRQDTQETQHTHTYTYMHICIYVFVYIYIYIHTTTTTTISISLSICLHAYIYIYIYTCVYIYIYITPIYTYTHTYNIHTGRPLRRHVGDAPDLRVPLRLRLGREGGRECLCTYIYIYIYIYTVCYVKHYYYYCYYYYCYYTLLVPLRTYTRRYQTCHFRKHATSVPAEGPAYGLDCTSSAGAEVAHSRKSHVWCRLVTSQKGEVLLRGVCTLR